MPKRILDGEALWRSDKLNKVEPLEFRAEYANLLPLALADGSFESNPKRVWSDVYSYNRPDVTVDLVEDILKEFERVGLLVQKTDETGKLWGKWVGIESRLPSDSTKDRYKNGNASIFNNMEDKKQTHDLIVTDSRPAHEEVMTGLVLDRNGLDIDRSGDLSSADNEISKGVYQEGAYPSKNPKKVHKYIVDSWQAIKGPAAIARYPSRYPQRWEEHCENHSGDITVPAFELWAMEEGIYSETEYPVSDFLKVSSKYMKRVVPTKTKQKPLISGKESVMIENLKIEKQKADAEYKSDKLRRETEQREILEHAEEI